jgi:hypothetical protein
VDPTILASARKHEVADNDMLHAYHHPIRVSQTSDLTMLIGADRKGHLAEVGVASAGGLDFIVHAMPAWRKFLR